MNAVRIRPMASAAELKQFQTDFEAVRAGRPVAMRFLTASREHARAARTMRRTRLAALEVAQALLRMHDSESWRDAYESWAALCRALRITRQDSYELMNCAKVASSLPEGAAGEMSRRDYRVLATPDREEEEPAGESGPLDRLRALLGTEEEDGEIDELESAKPSPERSSGFLQFVRRHVTMLTSAYGKRGLGAAAATHLEALLRIAEEHEEPAATARDG